MAHEIDVTTQPLAAPTSRSATDRMRAHRRRRRLGLRCLTVQLRETEIDVLVGKGLLLPEARNNARAIYRGGSSSFRSNAGFGSVTRSAPKETRNARRCPAGLTGELTKRRDNLVAEAAQALWYLMVQRDACGNQRACCSPAQPQCAVSL